MEKRSLDLEAGFDFDEYDVAKLPELPEEEKKKWYAKFYYRGRSEVPEEERRLFARGNTMDPEQALIPGKNMNSILEPGYREGDLGYCLLEDGVGYGSSRTVLETVPFEMFNWYKKLKVVDDLAYKVWYPGSHLSELGGISIEDVGFGLERIDPDSPCNPQNLGLRCSPEQADPEFAALIGGNAWMSPVENAAGVPPRALSLFHYVRNLPGGGCEFRTHFYVGAFCKNGALVKMESYEPETALEIARRMLSHCIYERNNLPAFLPEMYEKMKEMPL
ncbi:MAG: DAPG hydrolase family protein [Oscillospiraceae bacterium]